MADLTVFVDDRALEATWTGDAPQTQAALESALPIGGDAVRWGDELYIDVVLDVPPENAREVVPEGTLAYWPAGDKLCLFWGATPASETDEPRATAPVSVLARLEDASALAGLEDGARLRVESRTEC